MKIEKNHLISRGDFFLYGVENNRRIDGYPICIELIQKIRYPFRGE